MADTDPQAFEKLIEIRSKMTLMRSWQFFEMTEMLSAVTRIACVASIREPAAPVRVLREWADHRGLTKLLERALDEGARR